MQSWGTFRLAICEFWMNRTWLDKQKVLAHEARYRQEGYTTETPVSYVIRKLKLLQLVYDYTDSQLIVEIMSTAPRYWMLVVKPDICLNIKDFLNGVKYNEEALMEKDADTDLEDSDVATRLKEIETEFDALQKEFGDFSLEN